MMKNRVLAFGAHPDDIEIGMGGTIRKFAKRSYDIKMVFLWMPTTVNGTKEQLQDEGKSAAKILGSNVMFYNLDPNKIIHIRELINIIENEIDTFKPDEIFTHWMFDSHQEHRILTEAVISASRKNNCSVYMYEQMIPGGIVPYSFRAQMFIDISDEIEDKKNALMEYKSQVQIYGDAFTEGVIGRAKGRGFQIHKKAAECFEVIKEIKQI